MTRNKLALAVATSLLAFGLAAGPITASAQNGSAKWLMNNTQDNSGTQSNVTDVPEGPNDKADRIDQPEGPNDKADRNEREDHDEKSGGKDTDNIQEGPGSQHEGGAEDHD